jgi:lipid A 4'-phosphatase
MTATPPDRPYWTHLPSGRETARVAFVALVVGVVAGLVFSLWPQLDIAISRMFLDGRGGFELTQPIFWRFLREAFLKGFALWYITIAVAAVLALMQRWDLFGFDLRKWLYLAACSITGPLLLVNVYLKEHWGRWRPREVIELGGSELFTRPLDWAGTCDYNCSFVSGEVASMTMTFIALAFATTAWRPIFYILTVAMGVLSAFTRIGQGGHFASDTLFSGVFMVLIAAGLYWLFFLRDDERQIAGPQAFRQRLVEQHDAFWARLCDSGLAVLDRLFPRLK